MTTTEKEESWGKQLREDWKKHRRHLDGLVYECLNETQENSIADYWIEKLSHQQEELIGKVINMVKKADMAYMFPATEERFISDLKDLIKEQSNGNTL